MTIIYLNGKFAAQPLTGVQRFASELLVAVDYLLATGAWQARIEFVLLVPSGRLAGPLPKLKHILIQQLPAKQLHVWEQITLPLYTRGHLLLNLAGSAPLLKRSQVCTFHDAAVFDIPQAYSGTFSRWYRFLFRAQSHVCRRVLTVSEFSKQRLCHHLNMSEAAIGVVPNSADHVRRLLPDNSIIERLGLNPGGYLLAVGSNNPSKNFAALIAAFSKTRRHPDAILVVVGGGNSAVFAHANDTTPIDPRIIRAGRVTDEQLKSLYIHAKAFIFPSVYEGFGIPPLEAMACGCPVLASRAASIPEVCGEAAAYFDPHDQDDMVRTLERALDDPQWLDELRHAGAQRALRFTWEASARCLLAELSALDVFEATSTSAI